MNDERGNGWTPIVKLPDNEPGWSGRDEKKRQRCDRCGKWQFPCLHSCPGVWQER